MSYFGEYLYSKCICFADDKYVKIFIREGGSIKSPAIECVILVSDEDEIMECQEFNATDEC